MKYITPEFKDIVISKRGKCKGHFFTLKEPALLYRTGRLSNFLYGTIGGDPHYAHNQLRFRIPDTFIAQRIKIESID